jgi:ribosomal protein S18 acetylase RimI-like enzyme
MRAKSQRAEGARVVNMHTRAIHVKKLRGIVTVRPLADGDTATIAALHARLSDAARASRFHGPKPRLTQAELEQLAAVGPNRHVLVAHVEGDPLPAAVARVVRDGADRRAGEIAFAVADRYQGCGVGSALVSMLLDDARAAGIVHVNAIVQPANRPALRLLRRVLDRPTVQYEGAELRVSAT